MELNQLGYVTFVNITQHDELHSTLARANFQIFELDGTGIFDKKSFFNRANIDLPHEPGMITKESWDAFTDAIWGGVFSIMAVNIAVVWTHVEKMLVCGLPDLVTAIDCFKFLSSELEAYHDEAQQSRRFRVFLLGSGPNFPNLP
jgi:hypothetical protein